MIDYYDPLIKPISNWLTIFDLVNHLLSPKFSNPSLQFFKLRIQEINFVRVRSILFK